MPLPLTPEDQEKKYAILTWLNFIPVNLSAFFSPAIVSLSEKNLSSCQNKNLAGISRSSEEEVGRKGRMNLQDKQHLHIINSNNVGLQCNQSLCQNPYYTTSFSQVLL